MKVENLDPSPIEKIQFRLAFFKFIPQTAGCYILASFNNDVLYIGLASNLNSRFKQHLDNPEKTNPTADGKAIWFYYTTYNPKNLQKLERSWLNQFSNIYGRRPILNKVDSPVT